MAIILHIETATQCCSVAIAQDGVLLYKKEINEQNVHARLITLFIDEVISNSITDYAKIDAVAVSRGPGSYTGLRIGVSTAKGLCYALDKPLITVDTLQAMADGFKAQHKIGGDKILLCPMIDARRMEVYCALYDENSSLVLPTEAKIMDEHSFINELSQHKIYFFGDGAAKCSHALSAQSNAIIVDNFINSAGDMCTIAYQKFIANQFEDVAYFEPLYLKEFMVLSKT
ncbi:MAG: tRNA (adenosine(37)-N6)-threonylcarbamoyltransferase complex dimerization subunit type 1 TsaB [Sphingobacteriales bacterium]|jgi:tRNA threonylcarbamoyladenosine biosynthesis protein TsaB|nr:MAG: tRNA (adenosine(37)-N6)-threonylcarbamoyltransferase complex dimerization subunit type 1 TsaB [Sphingobacteriales bacterium]